MLEIGSKICFNEKAKEREEQLMITDSLDNLRDYAALNGRIAAAADFLAQHRHDGLPAGRYELEGDDLYVLIMEYAPSQKSTLRYESHEKYIDMQCMLAGSEYQWYCPREQLTPTTEYDGNKDIRFYEFNGEGSKLHLEEGQFAIYFPQDGHLPAVADASTGICRRAVVKIKW